MTFSIFSDMKLRWKLIFATYSILIISFLVICLLTCEQLISNADKELSDFRASEIEQKKELLKNYVDIAIGFIDSNYKRTQEKESLIQKSGNELKNENNIQKEFLEKLKQDLSQANYDKGIGYFWINDTGRPYPKMILHPKSPELNGKIMDDPKYNCALGKKENMFKAFVDAGEKDGGGFVDYLWPKPTAKGLTEDRPKLSYVRLYAPLKWVIGTGIYIDDIDETVNLKQKTINDQIKSLIFKLVGTFAVIAVLAFIFLSFIINNINKSFITIVESVKKFAAGDLTGTIDVKSKDEIGIIILNLNLAINNFKKIIQKLLDLCGTLLHSTKDISERSDNLASISIQMSSNSETIASATEEITANLKSISSASQESNIGVKNIAVMAEEMSANSKEISASTSKTLEKVKVIAVSGEKMTLSVNTVSTAIEEMSSSLAEVSKNSLLANKISHDAKQNADEVKVKMDALAKSSKQIGKIVGVIKDIADKTDMLALNATIEAAGAGDAGKGFAVVAGEVKELAKQSADATDEISGQIENIQKIVDDAVNFINKINTIISKSADINNIVASAVEEQTVTAKDISKNVADSFKMVSDVSNLVFDSSKLIEEISKAISESSKTADEVAKNITGISNAVKEVSLSTTEASTGGDEISKNVQEINLASKDIKFSTVMVNQMAKDLANDSKKLLNIVDFFKVGKAKFDIGDVKSAHLEWRSKLEGVIHGASTLKSDEITSDHECAFGKWYFGEEGKKFSVDPIFKEIGKHHKDVHSFAKIIVELHEQNKIEEAKSKMIEFEKSRISLFNALEEFYVS